MLHGRDAIKSDKTFDVFDNAVQNYMNRFECKDQCESSLVYIYSILAPTHRWYRAVQHGRVPQCVAHTEIITWSSALSLYIDSFNFGLRETCALLL